MAPSRPSADPIPPSRSGWRWGLYAAPALLACLAVAWSAFWFAAAARADAAVDELLEREAAQGRVYACAERRLIGFPFRIELVCERPTARLPAEGGEIRASAPRFVAAAQAYDPRRLIGELTGPVEIAAPDGARATLSFTLAQASAALGPERLERASISLNAPRLLLDATEIGSAQALLAHIRRAPGGAEGAYDLAGKLDGLVSPALDLLPAGTGAASVELQAQATGLEGLRPAPVAESLRGFAEAGGRLRVALARIVRGDAAVEGRGDLALDRTGRVEGALDVTARGLEGVIEEAIAAEARGALGGLMRAGAGLLGARTRLDGAPAARYRVSFDAGRMSVGPIQLWRAPPLF